MRHASGVLYGLVLALALLLGPSCASEDSRPVEALGAPAPEDRGIGAAKPTAANAGSSSAGLPARAPRKIIRNGHLQIRVKDYRTGRRRIQEIVETRGGFVFSSNVQHSDGRVVWAQLEFRIPSDQFPMAFDAIAEQGQVTAQSSNSRDITEQYYDVQARLTNAKRLESRLLELVASDADSVAELLEVEQALARVREEIERHQGTLRLYDAQTELSTLAVRLYVDSGEVAAAAPTFGDDVNRTLAESWTALSRALRGAALFVVSALPWLPLLALVGFFAMRLRRLRLLARRRPAHTP